jgi:hypothetical protein
MLWHGPYGLLADFFRFHPEFLRAARSFGPYPLFVNQQLPTIHAPSTSARIAAHRQRISDGRLLDSKNATSLGQFLNENDGFIPLVVVNVGEEIHQS